MLLRVLRDIFNLLGPGMFYRMTVTGMTIALATLVDRLIDDLVERH
jgi:ribose transport system permease protein